METCIKINYSREHDKWSLDVIYENLRTNILISQGNAQKIIKNLQPQEENESFILFTEGINIQIYFSDRFDKCSFDIFQNINGQKSNVSILISKSNANKIVKDIQLREAKEIVGYWIQNL